MTLLSGLEDMSVCLLTFISLQMVKAETDFKEMDMDGNGKVPLNEFEKWYSTL